MNNVLAVILGGGRGTRLYPLTKYRSKPAVPLAGKYRLIDVPVSNCLNSGLRKIAILTQFNSESLNKHIFRAYKLDAFSQGFVEIMAAEQAPGQMDWFQGSADAVRKCFKHFRDPHIKYILILSGDQVYKMDCSKMLKFHIEKNAEATIACNVVTKDETYDLGIMGMDKDSRIKEFIEKPKGKVPIDHLSVDVDGKERYLASMGIYLFNKEVLMDLLSNNQKADFGKEIIPDAIPIKRTCAYMYDGYWKDIGTIKSFYDETLAFTDPKPPLDLYDEDWQFFTRPRYLPLSKIQNSAVKNSSIAEGTVIQDAKITHSLIGLRNIIKSGTVIEDSILMGNDIYESSDIDLNGKPPMGIGKNCHIKKAIIDKNVSIGDNVKITNKKNVKEFENEYCVIRDGIIVIPKETVIPSGTII